jgi:photosystem II stability/assembly factor-like uncharacterized protein
MFYTTNGGINWIRNIIPPYGDFLRIQFLDRNTGWGSGPVGLIKKTTNGGLNWTDQSITGAWLDGLFFVNTLLGWVAGGGGNIHKTSNSGYNWISQISGYEGTLFSVCMINSNTGYIGMANGNILKTTNSGYNWIEIPTSLNRRLYDIQFFNEYTGFATGFYPEAAMVAKTINGGNNWIILLNSPGFLERLSFINEQTGWVCGSLGKIYYTTNSGLNWVQQSSGLATEYIYDIYFVSHLNGWSAASQGKILKTTTGGLITFINDEEKIFVGYELYQNYPNPFNSKTKIIYKISEKDFISLKLFDESGKLISVICQGFKRAGTHEEIIDMSFFSSGIYFYTLETKISKLTKKLIYIK